MPKAASQITWSRCGMVKAETGGGEQGEGEGLEGLVWGRCALEVWDRETW